MPRGVKPGALAMVAALAAIVFWPRQSQAATLPALPGGDFAPDLQPENAQSSGDAMPVDPIPAFLFLIRSAENRNVPDALRYQRFYGNATFYDLSDHPCITGEMQGVKLSDSMCRAAGLSPGCVSTAAGAYQIIKPTWQRVRKAGAWGSRLPDFSPDSQDEAARRLLIERGVPGALESGDFVRAVMLASREWASLPGSTAGQGGITMQDAFAFFDQGANYG